MINANASVIFAVKDDITDRLKNLNGSDIFIFILGAIESDYFSNHYVAIEELGNYWINFFDLVNRKEIILDIVHNDSIIYEDSHDLVMLHDSKTAKKIYRMLKTVTDKELVDYYTSHFGDDKDDLSQFKRYFNDLKIFLGETVANDAKLLLCIDKVLGKKKS